ncbi:MAG TPA: hypothetical protein VII84_09035 [Acidimicrobiales bacterium]
MIDTIVPFATVRLDELLITNSLFDGRSFATAHFRCFYRTAIKRTYTLNARQAVDF